ncbi:MAG TPA: serine/threonine-protein kinase, partial [Ktedonobacteraceae bacterium]|nr:serine/threonine-protein kinase [Ktedonobacteraceae bacterium]
HPDNILNPLLMLLQQSLNSPKIRHSSVMPLLNTREVLVIDAHDERARYITYLLSSAGFHPTTMPTALAAFTRFLKVPFAPCAIILGREDARDHFFLVRLLRQISQKFDWDTPLIRLHTQLPAPQLVPLPTFDELSPKISAPLPSVQTSTLFSNQTTSPLPPATLSSSSSSHPAISVPVTPVHEEERKKPGKPAISLDGQNIGRYQIHSPLGIGSESSVYLTYDRLREINVALKAVPTKAIIYHTGEQEKAEDHYFQCELDLIARLKHPHILPLLSCGETYISGFPFIYKVMPFWEEGSLADWLRQFGPAKLYPIQDVSHVISQLAEALQFAHDHQVTYQNIKLTNVIIQGKAKKMRQLHLLLADFAVVQDGTFTVKSPASFQYMAPEQWSGFSLPASDQYGLAVIAYELLVGRPPFQGHSEQVMKRMHTTMPPQPTTIFNPSISPFINNVLLRALAKKPEERFPSVKAFADALYRNTG